MFNSEATPGMVTVLKTAGGRVMYSPEE